MAGSDFIAARRFQSLLSQGISLLVVVFAGPRGREGLRFQSLLSQGISLLPKRLWRRSEVAWAYGVSIPS